MRAPLSRTAALAAVAVLPLTGCGSSSASPAASAPAPTSRAGATAATSPTSGSPVASTGPSASASPSADAPASAAATPAATNLSCPASNGASIRRAPGTGKTVALTFDDGPGPATPAVLDALDAGGVKATFFMTGAHAAQHPEVVADAVHRGHLVADHSYDHQYPKMVRGGWTPRYLGDQTARTAAVLTEASGQPVCFFRPPGGFMTAVADTARANRLGVVLWSVDTNDWKQPSTTTAAATDAIVAAATAAGSAQHPIVLMHDGKASLQPDARVSPNRSNTLAALPRVIAWYKDHGYTFVRMDGVG